MVFTIGYRIINYKIKCMRFICLISLFFLSISCEKPQPLKIVLPSALVTSISVSNGNVNVHASAENANFYTITFYENNDSTVIESISGEASYDYSESGTYTIKSKAHSTYSEYIEKTEQILLTILTGQGGAPTTGYTSPLSYPNYNLVWSDEFNGTSLSNEWTFDIGTGSSGWGNNELEYYTAQNATVSSGLLEIIAKEESMGGQQYTSSRIKTQGLESWKYGRIDIRAALPYSKGMWPALWMLGDNITSVGWPSCGEIDIMELIGGEGYNDRTVYGTPHWDNNGSHAQFEGHKTLANGKFADEFHVFSIIWDSSSIHWLIDNVEFHSMSTTSAELSEFQNKFFLIFNIAVGGNFPGSPDGTSVFPQSMYVDYVRVFQ